MTEGTDDEIDAGQLQAALEAAVRQFGRSRDVDQTLDAIVNAAVSAVPGAEQAGVSLVQRDGSVTSQVPTSDAVSKADQLQSTLGEGPCVTAIWEEQTVVIDDLAVEEHRWPKFAPQAVELGMASMLAFQLYVEEDTLGALNLYAGRTGNFTAESQAVGTLFAAHAALALGYAQHTNQLHQALESRDVIGQAKGILIERFGVSTDEAFSMLVDTSQRANIKLVDIARWLVDKGRR